MSAINITASQFEQEVIKSDKVVLVDFWAPWCGPCLRMAPILDQLSQDPDLVDKVKITKLNVDSPENQYLSFIFKIQSIPNLKIFKNGKIVSEVVGVTGASELKARLNELSN